MIRISEFRVWPHNDSTSCRESHTLKSPQSSPNCCPQEPRALAIGCCSQRLSNVAAPVALAVHGRTYLTFGCTSYSQVSQRLRPPKLPHEPLFVIHLVIFFLFQPAKHFS